MVKKILASLTLASLLVFNLCSFTTSTENGATRANTPLDSVSIPIYTPSIPNENYYITLGDPRILPPDTNAYVDWTDAGKSWTTYEFPLYNGDSFKTRTEQYCSSSNPVAYTDIFFDDETYLVDTTSAGVVLDYSIQTIATWSLPSIDSSKNYDKRFYIALFDTNRVVDRTDYYQNHSPIVVSGDFHYVNNVTGEVTTRTIENQELISPWGHYSTSSSYTIAFEMADLLDWLGLPTGNGYVTDLTLTLPVGSLQAFSRIRFIDVITPQSVLDANLADTLSGINHPIDDSFMDFGWIVNSVSSVFDLQLLPNITLFNIVTAGVGLALFIFILKRFAGG